MVYQYLCVATTSVVATYLGQTLVTLTKRALTARLLRTENAYRLHSDTQVVPCARHMLRPPSGQEIGSACQSEVAIGWAVDWCKCSGDRFVSAEQRSSIVWAHHFPNEEDARRQSSLGRLLVVRGQR